MHLNRGPGIINFRVRYIVRCPMRPSEARVQSTIAADGLFSSWYVSLRLAKLGDNLKLALMRPDIEYTSGKGKMEQLLGFSWTLHLRVSSATVTNSPFWWRKRRLRGWVGLRLRSSRAGSKRDLHPSSNKPAKKVRRSCVF